MIDAALARCDREEEQWDKAWAGKKISLQKYGAKCAEIEDRRTSLRAELERLDQKGQALNQDVRDAEMLVALCRQWQDNLDTFDMPKKRKVLESFNIRVPWSPGQEIKIEGNPSVFPEPFTASIALQ